MSFLVMSPTVTLIGGGFTLAGRFAPSVKFGTFVAAVVGTPTDSNLVVTVPAMPPGLVTITFTVGPATFSANPSSVSLTYPNGAQTVCVSSSSGTASSYTVHANNWLLVNGSGRITQPINSCFAISLSSTASTVANGTEATLNVVGNDSSSTSVFVTPINNTSGTGVTISPSSVTFSAPAGTFAQQSYAVTLTTSYSSVNVEVNYRH